MNDKEIGVNKVVSDLGACAYLMMHGFKVSGKRDKSFVFEVNHNDINDFEEKQVEYLSSDFHRFDSCLMSLKKLNARNI